MWHGWLKKDRVNNDINIWGLSNGKDRVAILRWEKTKKVSFGEEDQDFSFGSFIWYPNWDVE